MTVQARVRERNRKSEAAAQLLTTVGMPVTLVLDDGTCVETTLTELPWPLDHGLWVAKVECKTGGWDCARIIPRGKWVEQQKGGV